jgi:hypothetical protein
MNPHEGYQLGRVVSKLTAGGVPDAEIFHREAGSERQIVNLMNRTSSQLDAYSSVGVIRKNVKMQ